MFFSFFFEKFDSVRLIEDISIGIAIEARDSRFRSTVNDGVKYHLEEEEARRHLTLLRFFNANYVIVGKSTARVKRNNRYDRYGNKKQQKKRKKKEKNEFSIEIVDDPIFFRACDPAPSIEIVGNEETVTEARRWFSHREKSVLSYFTMVP